MTRPSLARLLAVAAAGTLLTALVMPSARGLEQRSGSEATPETSIRLQGSASAGSIFVDDPSFLIPYADQVLVSAAADLYAVRAFAEAQPVQPGTSVGLIPTLEAVLCPTCPVPPTPDLTATAESPTQPTDDVAPVGLTVGPVTIKAAHASAAAVAADHAHAVAEAAGLTGGDVVPDLSLKQLSSEVDLQYPGPHEGRGIALARAAAGSVGLIAIARALPVVDAVAGIEQPDGTVVPLPVEGFEIAPGTRVLGSAEATATSARAGVVVESIDASGKVVRTNLLDAVMRRFEGAPASAVVDPPATGVFAPSGRTDGSGAIGSGSSAFAPVRPVPTPSARIAAGDPVVVRSLRSVREGPFWLGWLFLAWLCLGAAATAAGRRWLAPRIAMDATVGRAARAAGLDDLDRGTRR